MTTRLLLYLSAFVKFAYGTILLWAQRKVVTASTAVVVNFLGWPLSVAMYYLSGFLICLALARPHGWKATAMLLSPNFLLGCIAIGTIVVAMVTGVYPDKTRVTPEHICMDQLVPLIWVVCVIKCTLEWVNKQSLK